jgi:hypothetical protein
MAKNGKLSRAIKRGLARKKAAESAALKTVQVTRAYNHLANRKVKGEEINHPEHYQASTTSMEVADVCEAFELDWHTGTAVKYLLRAGKKDAEIADIKKALWYITRRANKKLGKALLIDEEGNVNHLNVPAVGG